MYAQLGRFDEAFRLLPPAEAHLANVERGSLGFSLARAGRVVEARKLVAEMETFSRVRYVSGDAIAAVYAGLGDTDRAIAALERAADEHAFTLVFTGLEPMYNSLHGDPRFRRLLGRIGVK